MKIITFLFINVLGFKLQAAFYSNVFSKYINLFDLNLNEGIECSKMEEIVDFMLGIGMIKTKEPYWRSSYYRTPNNPEKELLMKQAYNIENVTFTKNVTELIFVVNGRLVTIEDLPILRMLFGIIKYKKNTWECIDTLNEQIEIYENCDKCPYLGPYTYQVIMKEDYIKFRDACNELENFKGQPILALTKRAICFYIKNNPKITDEDLNNFLQQDDGLIFECSEKIKEAFLDACCCSEDMVMFDEKYVAFINYLH